MGYFLKLPYNYSEHDNYQEHDNYVDNYYKSILNRDVKHRSVHDYLRHMMLKSYLD